MTIDNEYTILTDYANCIIWGRTEPDLVQPLGYDELPHLSEDVHEEIRKVEDIYYNQYQVEVGWPDEALMNRYNQLMMTIGERVKKQFGANKVHVWQENADNSGKYIDI